MGKLVVCDARPSSTLEWKEARSSALSLIASGKKVLWFLDFGLFDEVQKPLDHPGQFANFALAIDHFQNKLWEEFHKFSLGVVIYKGNAEYSFLWDEKQEANYAAWLKEYEGEEHVWMRKLYARDLCSHYLEQLSSHFFPRIQVHIVFDPLPGDPVLKALLTDPEKYGRIKTNEDWKIGQEKEVGIYFPSFLEPAHFLHYQKIFKMLEGRDYKLIPENQLITAWQGLNTLYYHSPSISTSGHRKIQGFLAAGGDAVDIDLLA